MNKLRSYSILLALAIALPSCGSGVSLAKVNKQEEEAREDLQDAHSAMIKLAELKQEYSVDSRDRQIKALQKQQKAMESDVKKLQGVSTTSAEGSAQALANDLERQNKELDKQISSLKNQNKENWAMAIDSINSNVRSLERAIDEITANLPEED